MSVSGGCMDKFIVSDVDSDVVPGWTYFEEDQISLFQVFLLNESAKLRLFLGGSRHLDIKHAVDFLHQTRAVDTPERIPSQPIGYPQEGFHHLDKGGSVT